MALQQSTSIEAEASVLRWGAKAPELHVKNAGVEAEATVLEWGAGAPKWDGVSAGAWLGTARTRHTHEGVDVLEQTAAGSRSSDATNRHHHPTKPATKCPKAPRGLEVEVHEKNGPKARTKTTTHVPARGPQVRTITTTHETAHSPEARTIATTDEGAYGPKAGTTATTNSTKPAARSRSSDTDRNTVSKPTTRYHTELATRSRSSSTATLSGGPTTGRPPLLAR